MCQDELEKGNTAAACFANTRAVANESMILENKNKNHTTTMKITQLLFLSLAVATLTIVCGCSKPEQKPEQKALKSFELVVAEVREATNSWGKRAYSDISFNVKKTDSLVSPFAGLIRCKDEKDQFYIMYLAFQDSKWVVIKTTIE